ncbi:YlmH/Sll1252 family protein [Clostridium fallax]|uniref:RNA-binding protein YlmH, contains S4-like domain n=1 Tax=Clostridium fallax TaxID=1533 RepID=A0A1M4YIK3_9CLOT|nr:YlmH/Sll1252 family protein [Clostridium fallax]SHF05599.1 RNA-binding protein YlmH, contains S4-like domain [Clostridium fallax]SQB06311.1 RNA-binding S4 domain-containing protein [Clostridium fallax]
MSYSLKLKEMKELLDLKDEDDISSLYNKYLAAKKSGRRIVTNYFYAPNIYDKLKVNSNKLSLSVESYGGVEDAEKRLIAFNYEDSIENWPLICIKIITPKKFNNLSHKDYLGAIMALGIERGKFGDLRVKENQCYIMILEEIGWYVVSNLTKIGKLGCTCQVVEDLKEIPLLEFDNLTIQSSSYRLDSIVSALTKKSRKDSVELISSGMVMVDYLEIRNKSFEVKENNRVTIRKCGKYIIKELLGETKSGRYKILVNKFI